MTELEVHERATGMVSRYRDSAREALDAALEHQQLVQRGVRAP